MSYKIIKKNKFGFLVEQLSACQICKYKEEKSCLDLKCGTDDKYYLPDSEVERLESENDLKAKNEELKKRITELEKTIENNVTELIHRTGDLTHDFWYFCAECLENFEMDHGFNYCPNCGRKIIRK